VAAFPQLAGRTGGLSGARDGAATGVGYNSCMSSSTADDPFLLRRARFAELTPFEVYGLCRLRVDVFVVEQACPYPELDGRDPEPGTVHLWLESDGEPASTIRVLDEGATRAIGRVATAAGFRGRGQAARRMPSARSSRSPWAHRHTSRAGTSSSASGAAGPATSRTASPTCPCGGNPRDGGRRG
jgi:hypothetical protein